MAARKLAVNTVVVNPKTGAGEELLAGDPVPDWASDLVGDYLLVEPSAPKSAASKPPAKPAAK